MCAALRTARRSARTISRANSGASAVEPLCRASASMTCVTRVATLLLQQGFSLKQIQDWLGHADISTTANVYAHVPYIEKETIAKNATPVIEI